MDELHVAAKFQHGGATLQIEGHVATYVVARRFARSFVPDETSMRGGAYLLLSDPDARGTRVAYVGQSADGTGARLAAHDRQKSWWSTFIDVTPIRHEIPRDLSTELELQLHAALAAVHGMRMDNLEIPSGGRSRMQAAVARNIVEELAIVLKGLLDIDLDAAASMPLDTPLQSMAAPLTSQSSLAVTPEITPSPFTRRANGPRSSPSFRATVPSRCRAGSVEYAPATWKDVWLGCIDAVAQQVGVSPVREWLLAYHERTSGVGQPLATTDSTSFTRTGTRGERLGLIVGTNFSASDCEQYARNLSSHFALTFDLEP